MTPSPSQVQVQAQAQAQTSSLSSASTSNTTLAHMSEPATTKAPLDNTMSTSTSTPIPSRSRSRSRSSSRSTDPKAAAAVADQAQARGTEPVVGAASVPAAPIDVASNDKLSPVPAPGPGGPGGPGAQAPLQLSKWRFFAIFMSLMMSIFLFALDQLIIATAIPKITIEFSALTQLPWLANGFFLTLFGANLIYSQWLTIFPSKHVIMFAVSVFEIGSLLCGVAPNIDVLILGRAVAGLGAAGIFSGGMVVIAEMTTLRERAKYMGLFGVCFAIASIIGPLIGGAFSDHISWRWCFYINLPFGGLALALQVAFQPTSPPLGRAATYTGYSRAMIGQVARCDWLGAAIAMGWACCFILALQWGGVERAWNDGGVVACLVLTGVLPFVFVAWEWYIGDKAMFKLELIKRRTIAGAATLLFFLFATMMLLVYYLSLAFQAVYDSSATQAGVKLLPLILVQVVVLIASSRIVPLIGRFKWVIVAGPVFTTIASGALYTVKYGTPEQHLYGFQAILGIGIGMAMQNSMLAVQFDLKDQPRLIPQGTGLAVFSRIVGISLAGSVFSNTLQTNLARYAPNLPAQLSAAVLNDASAVWRLVPDQLREGVLVAYTETLRNVYLIGVPAGILGLVGALAIKNSKMESKKEETAGVEAAREKERDGAAAAVKDKELGQGRGNVDEEKTVG